MNKKLHLAMLSVTGLLPAVAQADIRAAQTTKILASSTTDLAPVTGTTPPRLRRTDEEQPGNEMVHTAMFGDGKSGLLFSMNTDLNGVRANHRVQLAMVPFHLVQAADGSVSAVADMAGARYVTDNDGNEYRNANHPIAYSAFGGTNICAEYNYQPNDGSNDTKRYMQCFDTAGKTVMPQTQIYAKTNDDCSMNQDKSSTWIAKQDASITKLVAWRGCNGNGDDDGWLQAFTLNKDAAGKVTFNQTLDVSLCPREERSHGFCTTSTTDPNTAVCSWTEGNTQPQRDGTWLAGVDISGAKSGQDAIIWKQMIDGSKLTEDGHRTYSMRAMHDRIMTVNSSTGQLEASDLILWRSADVRGNNNTDNGKGGTYLGNQMAVMRVGKQLPTYVMPMTNMATKLLGLEGTHLGMTSALFGTTDKLTSGFVFVSGSQLGGGYSAQLRSVGWDKGTNSFKDLGMTAIAPYDRHLYPNYLGNNPGNQGRNYNGVDFIKNPFVGLNGNTDAYLVLVATSGKDPAEKDEPQKKLSVYISVVPIAQTAPSGTGSGSDTGSGSGSDTGSGSDNGPSQTLGGCSSTGGAGGLAFILVGLVGLIRRRNRK